MAINVNTISDVVRERTRVLCIGKADSVAYVSIKMFTDVFSRVEFFDEHSFKSLQSLLDELDDLDYDLVIMPNPYGNERRRLLYHKLRVNVAPVFVFDRGALPGSWFFDTGFNADSATYKALRWDVPLGREALAQVASYVSNYRSGNKALERQCGREGSVELKERLGLSGRRVLFVPFQRPNDTTIKYFSGSVSNLMEFALKVELIQQELKQLDSNWTVICKKHPLETSRLLSESLRYVDDDTNVDDLIELSDAVCLVNSGVGVLSMLWGKPVYHFGEAFYSHPRLNRRVHEVHEVVYSLLRSPVDFDAEARDRFIYHLIERVYSFGKFTTELVCDGDVYRTVTTDIQFNKIMLPEINTGAGRRVLFLTAVLPHQLNRGSVLRTRESLRALADMGYTIDLVILNRSDRNLTSALIAREVRKLYAGVRDIVVKRHPTFSAKKERRGYNFICKLDSILDKDGLISNENLCPANFRKAVARSIEKYDYDDIFVNYLYLLPAVPSGFRNNAVVDIHDFQTNRICNDVVPTLPEGKQGQYLRRFEKSELNLMAQANKILSISSEESKIIKSKLPSIDIYSVPASCEDPLVEHDSNWQDKEYDCVFIGSNSDANRDSLIWFLDQVLPLVVLEKPDVRVLVAGNICRNKQLKVNDNLNSYITNSVIKCIGLVEDLSTVYAMSKVVVCPIVKGTGMKIKVVEAISFARPLIATSIALEGYVRRSSTDFISADSSEDFAKAILSLLNNAELANEVAMNGQSLFKEHYSSSICKQNFMEVFDV